MANDKFIEEIEKIRMKLSNRIDMLHKHESEYLEDDNKLAASRCDLKARQLYMVLNDIDKALNLVG